MVPLDDTIKDDIQTFEIIADDLLCQTLKLLGREHLPQAKCYPQLASHVVDEVNALVMLTTIDICDCIFSLREVLYEIATFSENLIQIELPCIQLN